MLIFYKKLKFFLLLARKYAEERKIEKEKEKAKERENKNTSILATGAICIVLLAIALIKEDNYV